MYLHVVIWFIHTCLFVHTPVSIATCLSSNPFTFTDRGNKPRAVVQKYRDLAKLAAAGVPILPSGSQSNLATIWPIFQILQPQLGPYVMVEIPPEDTSTPNTSPSSSVPKNTEIVPYRRCVSVSSCSLGDPEVTPEKNS